MAIALPLSAAPALVPGRHSFRAKAGVALLLVAAADWLFFPWGGGTTIAAWALAALAGTLAVMPAAWGRASRLATGAALIFAFALAWDPSVLALALFWIALSFAVLIPKAPLDDGWRWALRLGWQAMRAAIAPAADWGRLRRARARGGSRPLFAHAPTFALPLLGSLVFLALFAAANPLISNAFARIDLAVLVAGISIGRIAFWGFVALPVWALLRPRAARLGARAQAGPETALPGVSPRSVALSLLAFNLIFAVQNALDVAFLWSGAPLPAGVTLADYAHRGAYPLIATALIAGVFVLVTLRPESPLADSTPRCAGLSMSGSAKTCCSSPRPS